MKSLSLSGLFGKVAPSTRNRRSANPRHKRPNATRLSIQPLEDRLALATLTVNTLADTVDANPGVTSLREAITAANSQAGDDIIDFSVAGTINLTGAPPDLSSNIQIQGPGAAGLTVRRDTGGDYRIFTVAGGPTVVLDGLTISDGIGVGGIDAGGGIYNNGGTLTVSNSALSGNSATLYSGGGIFNDGAGTLTVISSTLSGNSASNGGGIGNNGTLTVINSTLSGNSSVGYGGGGGGIASFGMLTVINSTLSGNSANDDGGGGGGILNAGTLTVSNSTLSGNSVAAGYGRGGGIANYFGTLTVSNSTLAGNFANYGGGIANYDALTLNNTIVANSTSGGDVANFGGVTGSHNLIEDGSDGLPDTITGDPNLGPLANNGGPTQTHALLIGSPAIDAGSNALVPLGVTTDQRGFARFDRTVEVGAFEVQRDVQSVTIDIHSESLIFGAVDFQASQIDVDSVQFAGATAWQFTFVDANNDGHLDLQLKFRRQETILDQIYAELLEDDFDADGVLDSTGQTAEIAVTGETLDGLLFSGSDDARLFLSGRALRDLLDELFA